VSYTGILRMKDEDEGEKLVKDEKEDDMLEEEGLYK
jgi:hypothetical protein